MLRRGINMTSLVIKKIRLELTQELALGQVTCSVVIIFKLMSHRRNDDSFAVNDLEKRDIARPAKWDHQLAQEWTGTRFAASERRRAQGGHAVFDGLQRPVGQVEFTVVTLQFALQHKIK